MGERRNVGKPAGKRLTARKSHRCEDNIKMCFNETGCDGMDKINLAQDRSKGRRTEENLLANYRPCHTEVTDKREVVLRTTDYRHTRQDR